MTEAKPRTQHDIQIRLSDDVLNAVGAAADAANSGMLVLADVLAGLDAEFEDDCTRSKEVFAYKLGILGEDIALIPDSPTARRRLYRSKTIAAYASATGMAKGTLRNARWVGRCWPRSLREQYPRIADNFTVLYQCIRDERADLELADLADREGYSAEKIRSLKHEDGYLVYVKRARGALGRALEVADIPGWARGALSLGLTVVIDVIDRASEK